MGIALSQEITICFAMRQIASRQVCTLLQYNAMPVVVRYFTLLHTCDNVTDVL